MMEETQNGTVPEAAGEEPGRAKGGAKLIRPGNGADNGADPAGERGQAKAEEAGSAAAGVILQAGRRAAAGAQAATARVEEGVEALEGEAARRAQAAAATLEETAGAGRGMLAELVSSAQRASVRNARALAELFFCRTPFDLLYWQSKLLNETLSDLRDTNGRIQRLVANKG